MPRNVDVNGAIGINVKVDNTRLLLKLRNGQKRLVYAVVNASNNTAKRVQQADQGHAKKIFQIRKDFVLRNVAVIKPFASVAQGRPYAEISVAKKPRLLLGTFEAGGPKKDPGKRTAVPITGSAARPTFSQSVPEALYFKALNLQAFHANKLVMKKLKSGKLSKKQSYRFGTKASRALIGNQGIQWKGEQRSWIMSTKSLPSGGVFQRTGPGKNDIHLLYAFKGGVLLGERLKFVLTARKVADQWYREEMENQVSQALIRDGGRSL